MNYCCDTGTVTGWDLPPMLADGLLIEDQPVSQPRQTFFRRLKSVVWGALPIPSAAPAASDALPGEVISPEVAENEEQRRIIGGIFSRFAAESQVSRATAAAAETFIHELPRNAPLPRVTTDGDGGVLMAWTTPAGRTLASLADGVLCVVTRAGTADAAYLPEVPFDGIIPEGLLLAITA